MRIRNALVALVCALGLVACDDGGEGTDAGPLPMFDAGPGGDTDAGPGGDTDAGPGGDTDAGPGGGTDSGPGADGSTGTDAGPGGDAGCTAMTACGPGDCGTTDDGCGGTLDCGACTIGDRCGMDADCDSMDCLTETDTAWTDGYCTDQCRYDSDCGTGTHCGYRNDVTLLGICVLDCTADTDCRAPDYTCRDADEAGTTECAPTASGAGGTGMACTSYADCAGGVDGFCVPQGTGFFDGVCSSTCMVDGDCSAGNHCGFVSTTTLEGICVPDCTTSADCRTMGYACYDADEDGGATECWGAGTGTAAPGDPCAGLWECAGMEDALCVTDAGGALDGYCTTLGCTPGGTDCATGSHCVTFTGATTTTNACLKDCTADTDCRAMGYACYDVDETAAATTECWAAGTGTGAIGDACEGVWDCAGRERAFCIERPANDFLDGYCALAGCTNPPAVGSDCPTGSHCTIFTTMGVPNATGICTDDCATAADCRGAGYACFDTGDVDTAPECWPGGTGTGVTGDACRWVEDCAGGDGATCLIDQLQPGVAEPFRGGYCTDSCTVDSDCTGTGAVCQSGLCVLSCTAPLDCRMMDSYTCTIPPFTGFTQNICWPN